MLQGSIPDVVYPVFTEESTPSLFSVALPERGDLRADSLVAAYRYLCRRGARKFWRAGLERCDLEQVAAIGLIKASRRFDHAAGTPFEAYAWLTIVGELMHYVRDYERIVRIPRRLWSLEPKYARARDTCIARFGREPRDCELAAEMGVLEGTVAEMRSASASAAMLSLEDPGARALSCDSELGPEDRLLVSEAFARLSAIERRVIVGVYVLGLTQLELGRRLGLSARRVSRIRSNALRAMQRAWAS
jgi:RNA polymerase sigma-B factor